MESKVREKQWKNDMMGQSDRKTDNKKAEGEKQKAKKHKKQNTSEVQQNNMWPKYDNEIKEKEKWVDEMLSSASHTIIIHWLRSIIHHSYHVIPANHISYLLHLLF